MIGHATSPFTVDHFEEHGTEVLPGARVSKARIAKTFTGDVDGTGVVEMISVHNETGPAAYVGIERVDASVHGRRGTFVFQHNAVAVPTPTLTLTVVPGTGTGDLEGISGRAHIDIDDQGNHTLVFEYELGGV